MRPTPAILIQRFAMCAVIIAWWITLTFASAPELSTPQVKARYIHNFIKYISWPEKRPEARVISIGICQSPEIAGALEAALQAKSADGAALKVLALGSPEICAGLDLFYIPEMNREKITRILGQVSPGTLTIGEAPGFVNAGGMIEFKLLEGKVRFNVNLYALRQAGFVVDTKLLKVAEEVIGK